MSCASGIRDVVVNFCSLPSEQKANSVEKVNEEKKALEAQLEITKSQMAHLEAMQKHSQEMQDALQSARDAKAETSLQARKLLSASVGSNLNAMVAEEPPEGGIGQMTTEELDTHYDLVIIGGGPVGLAAAIKCACLGHRAIIIDKPKLPPRSVDGLDVSFGGPTGLFSKALRDTAKHVDVPSLQSMHLDNEVIWHQVHNMCLRLAESNAAHQVKTLKNFKIDYLQATANVISAKNVLVQRFHGEAPAVLATDHVLLATGSKPMRPMEIPFDDVRIFDSDTINTLTFLPKSVAVMGSGIIAIEYAKIFRKLGVKVTMLVRSGCQEALSRIGLDNDIAAKLIEVLKDDDVDIYEGTTVEEWDVPLTREHGPLTLKLKSSKPEVPTTLKVDIFLGATGRVPNTTGWGCEKLGMKLTKRGAALEVTDEYETSVPGIFAAGDVIGPPALASTGVYQAQQAVLEVFGEGHMNKYKSFPVGMWTTPECGYYGLTLEAAKKEGMDVQEGCVDYSACLRGRVFAPCGLLKLVFNVNDGVIVGVHILGEDACELVHYGMDLVCQGVSIFKVMTTCYTAVTFHELFKEAALNGNSKLEFGLEWHKVLDDIGVHMDNHEHGVDLEKMKPLFDEIDVDGDGCLSETELKALFEKYGCNMSRAIVHNLVRLVDEGGDGMVHWDQFSKIFDIIEEVRSNSHFGKEKYAEQAQEPEDGKPTRRSSTRRSSQVKAPTTPEKSDQIQEAPPAAKVAAKDQVDLAASKLVGA